MADKSLFREVELYDMAEIAQILGVGVGTVRKYIIQGRLKARRMGRKWKATKGQIVAFLEAENEAPSPGSEFGVGSWELNPQPAEPEPEPKTQNPKPETRNSEVTEQALVKAAESQLANLPADNGDAALEAPRLLFLKPEDLDKLVSALAAHVESVERGVEERERRITELATQLLSENSALREEMSRLRAAQAAAVEEAVRKILSELNSTERREMERFRFQWVQERLEQLAAALQRQSREPNPSEEEGPPPYYAPRRWWQVWRR